jgi:rfaE bifunctional protein kinase chain/domain
MADTQVRHISRKIGSPKIAVIGDVMLDQFIEGVIERRNPESSAPVIFYRKDYKALGGAANVAHNIASLGGRVKLFSVVGNDLAGKEIKKILKKFKINSQLISDKNRITTQKVRVLGNEKYIVRFDKEDRKKISKEISNTIINKVKKELHTYKAIALSDYDKGLFTKDFTQKIIALAKEKKVPIIADIKPRNLKFFKGVTLLKSNKKETVEMAQTKNIGKAVGADGMRLYSKEDKKDIKISGIKVKVQDIIGAGDVVLAGLAVCLAGGLSLYDSVYFSNFIAAQSVKQKGTSVASLSEIK